MTTISDDAKDICWQFLDELTDAFDVLCEHVARQRNIDADTVRIELQDVQKAAERIIEALEHHSAFSYPALPPRTTDRLRKVAGLREDDE